MGERPVRPTLLSSQRTIGRAHTHSVLRRKESQIDWSGNRDGSGSCPFNATSLGSVLCNEEAGLTAPSVQPRAGRSIQSDSNGVRPCIKDYLSLAFFALLYSPKKISLNIKAIILLHPVKISKCIFQPSSLPSPPPPPLPRQSPQPIHAITLNKSLYVARALLSRL